MKLLADDSYFPFPGVGGCRSHCQVKIYSVEQNRLLLYLHDPLDNQGTTVTNAIEGLAGLICRTIVPCLEIKAVSPEDIMVLISSDHDSELMFSWVTFSNVSEKGELAFAGRNYQFAGWSFDEAVKVALINPPTKQTQ